MQLNLSRRSAVRLLALSAVLSSALLQGCDSVPSVIKIGVAQPLTGNLSALGQDLLNGVNLAVEELNKEGYKVKGKTVTFEVVAVDDRANADTGKEVAQQLVDAGVVAVIGHLNSGVSIAAAPIYAEKGIAQLAISTNPKYTQLGLDTTFRLVANDTLQAKAIGSYSASQFSGTKFALLDDGTPYGKDLAAGAGAQLKAAKKEVVLQQSFDDKTTKFEEVAAKIKETGVEVVVSTLNDFQIVALLDALKAISYTNIKVLGGDTIKTTLMLKGAGVASGLFATSPILEAREFTAGGAFLDKYRAKYKIDPAYAGHYTYDAMYVLAAAIRRAESAKPKDITATLKKIDGYAPVTGSMKWDAQGEQRYGVIGVYSANGGLWESQMRSDNW
ncbi:branched-chain amino acid ABC transporter substrate-binding protein [Rhodoferax sp. TS-BS-61-7]|uniref:branched-chain amino acid ABC transporter substrate-binding protein n=1 Tax=Rhodoferax sp. TS-BS-61-7 TaxID=2094194 RepID=UPI000CF68E9A|nr:branched-chain amino acid ABC transporter substrate-binding protein [Rhodoferax sp. TS-BS-61-7]PQA76374.1 branched chain amino acid ABC transporter substrate-binding protein [Rhodoferax sp. TS-BS-61-7]